MGIRYVTREAIKTAPDMKTTARADAEVDAANDAATDAVHAVTHRVFYPWTGTRYFDWPSRSYSSSWRLWLEGNEVASVSAIVAGGTAITDYFLRRPDDRDEAPYQMIEIDLGGSDAFSSASTWQRAIAVTGVFIGCPLAEDPAGALAEALDTSETAVDVTDSGAVGVGSILRADTERMLVTGRRMLTTGQTLQTPLTASMDNETVAVTSGAGFAIGEVLLLDAERMLVVDIAGNSLIVKRKWDGSTLAAHTGSTIYASRTLTVERGALGTTAAAHDTATAIAAHRAPGLVQEYALAYAVDRLLQRRAGYARTTGSGDHEREATGRGLRAIERDLRNSEWARKARVSAV